MANNELEFNYDAHTQESLMEYISWLDGIEMRNINPSSIPYLPVYKKDIELEHSNDLIMVYITEGEIVRNSYTYLVTFFNFNTNKPKTIVFTYTGLKNYLKKTYPRHNYGRLLDKCVKVSKTRFTFTSSDKRNPDCFIDLFSMLSENIILQMPPALPKYEIKGGKTKSKSKSKSKSKTCMHTLKNKHKCKNSIAKTSRSNKCYLHRK